MNNGFERAAIFSNKCFKEHLGAMFQSDTGRMYVELPDGEKLPLELPQWRVATDKEVVSWYRRRHEHAWREYLAVCNALDCDDEEKKLKE